MIGFILGLILCVCAIFLIINTLAQNFGSVEKFKFKFKMNFVKGDVNHNEITNIKKGECLFKIENNKFYVLQGDNSITDNMPDVYNFRVWQYENALYFSIRMKTHSEYMFNPVNSDITVSLLQKIADRFKIELVDCGESGNE